MRDRVIAWLRDHVSAHRLQHILGVEQTCIQLAQAHQVDVDKASWAGLMHDLAKFFPPEKLLSIATREAINIDPIVASYPHLLHADVGAIVAREEFAVQEPDILAAIANHTLGSPGMSRLSCVVFVADAIEPFRGNHPELEAIRLQAYQNLYHSVRQTCDYSLKYLISKTKIIHPRVIATRNWALAQAKQFSAENDNIKLKATPNQTTTT